MQETQEIRVQSLGGEDPLEEGMATPSSILVHGKSHGHGSLADLSLWGHKESDTTEQLNNNSKQLKTTWSKEVLLMGCQSTYMRALV